MGVPSFIEDHIYQAMKDRQAIERVRKVIEKHWNENICSLSTYEEIIKALDGEK